jgi:hypothetical protein
MTDLAATFADLSAIIDRIGVTHADVLSMYMSGGVLTLHLQNSSVSRLVAAHGDTTSHSVLDRVVNGVTSSHHHTVAITGTNGRVKFMWVTFAATVAQTA